MITSFVWMTVESLVHNKVKNNKETVVQRVEKRGFQLFWQYSKDNGP